MLLIALQALLEHLCTIIGLGLALAEMKLRTQHSTQIINDQRCNNDNYDSLNNLNGQCSSRQHRFGDMTGGSNIFTIFYSLSGAAKQDTILFNFCS